MARNEILILHCPAGGGHKAAAMAIAEHAEARGLGTRVIDVLAFAPAWFARFYVDTHLRSSAYVPRLYGSAYFASNHRSAVEGELRERFDEWIGKPLVDEILASDPLAVVATHFLPIGRLVRARQRGMLRAPIVEVITDYAAHAVWAEPGADAYCAPHGRACEDLVSHGVSPALVFATGIPVRSAFASAPPIRRPVPGVPLRVLITSGGFGVGPVTRVLRSLAGVRDVSLTVVCGQNPHLVRRVRRVTDRLGIEADVVGFERNMPARVAEADVVVTKPGGLTVSECLAAGRPLVLVGAVPGQESLNQAWVTEQGAGTGCTPEQVGGVIFDLRGPKLVAMADRARAVGVPHAADRVLAVTLSLAGTGHRSVPPRPLTSGGPKTAPSNPVAREIA
jgi:processive 1,2-diacylglycerol beta-glucosyltransferase